jgi:hypothetical protein
LGGPDRPAHQSLLIDDRPGWGGQPLQIRFQLASAGIRAVPAEYGVGALVVGAAPGRSLQRAPAPLHGAMKRPLDRVAGVLFVVGRRGIGHTRFRAGPSPPQRVRRIAGSVDRPPCRAQQEDGRSNPATCNVRVRQTNESKCDRPEDSDGLSDTRSGRVSAARGARDEHSTLARYGFLVSKCAGFRIPAR